MLGVVSHAAPTATAAEAYRQRFRRVLAYIDRHLDEDLSATRLSLVAGFSRFHFHRQFSALFGIGAVEVVQQLRLHRAACSLAYRDTRILDIAGEAGYDSHEAFGRAFRRRFGQTPSGFRQSPAWDDWHHHTRVLRTLRVHDMAPTHRFDDVTILHFDGARVAALEHRGAPHRLGQTIRRFIAWRRAHRLPPSRHATYNIVHDDPVLTPDDEFRFEICTALDGPLPPNDDGVVEKTIAAGRCAVLRHHGSDDLLGASVEFLYRQWLPQSGEEPRDAPLFMQRVRFFPDVPESEAITDIFLPLT